MADTSTTAGARPKVSVVLPTYDRAHVVMEAVESVLAQTFTDLELIVVDDRSTDDTLGVLATITDPRVKVLQNSRTKGAPGARNMGIFAAGGDWVCHIDSDDLWDPRFLEEICEGIDRAGEDVGIVHGSLAFVEDGRTTSVRRAEAAGHTFPRMLYEHFFFHTASAFRASLLRDIGGYDETLSVNEDTDMQLRMTERCEMLPVPDAMYYYRSRAGERMTRGHADAAASMKRYLDKHAALFALHPLARYRAVNAVLTAALRAGSWRLAMEMWLGLLPASLRMPRWFGRHALQAVRLVSAQLLEGRRAPAR